MNRSFCLMCATLLLLTCQVSQAYSQHGEPCKDSITVATVSARYPGISSIPADREYQKRAEYRHSYIFMESFEDSSISQAFRTADDANWGFQSGDAKNGRRFLRYTESLESITDEQLLGNADNWMILGPFDLSSIEGGVFNLYIRLGDSENNQTGTILLLVSIDGSTFHGYRFSGTTCNWCLKGFDLSNVPELGNVCGKADVWFAFVPGVAPSGIDIAIDVDHIRILATNTGLPAKSKAAPVSPAQDHPASYDELIRYYSPYVIQDLDDPKFGDYITCFNYDGDFVADNNWDNLGIDCGGEGCDDAASGCHQAQPLPAYVYASIVETVTDYYLCYAFFHPADDYYRTANQHHENDLEGIVMKVIKDGTPYGNLQMVQTQAHWDYYQYVPIWFDPPESYGIYDSDVEDIEDDPIYTFIDPNTGIHPVVYIEGGGHGIHVRPGGIYAQIDGPFIHYLYKGAPQAIMHPNVYSNFEENPYALADWQRVGYDIILISAEFWQKRRNYCTSGCVFKSNSNNINLQRFLIYDVGVEFDGNTCMCTCVGNTCVCGAAAAPWWWQDDDDAGVQFMAHGEWFLDPAHYHIYQFYWDFLPSQTYTFSTFLYNQLCGEIYGDLSYFESPSYPYSTTGDVFVSENRGGLLIQPNVLLRFASGSKLTAYGPVFMNGNAGTIRMKSMQSPDIGIKLDAHVRMQNGASIKIH